MEQERQKRAYYIVNVKDYPLNSMPSDDPPRHDRRPRSRPSTQAYIGNSPRKLTFIPFCILLTTSIIFLITYIGLFIRYRQIIDILNLDLEVLLLCLICVLDITSSIIGLKVLEHSVVKLCNLFLLHAFLFSGIITHLFAFMLPFMPDNRNIAYEKNQRKLFPEVYWKCFTPSKRHSSNKNVTLSVTTPSDIRLNDYCNEVLGIGRVFWSSLFLFAILLLAWRMSLCHSPVPIHNVRTKKEAKDAKRYLRSELNTLYKHWQFASSLEKPYVAHYPNNFMDDNANAVKSQRQHDIIVSPPEHDHDHDHQEQEDSSKDIP